MKLDRFRAPALAATAVLLISGAGIAFAGSPAPAAPEAVSTTVEAATPETDLLQQGDQTTPDAPATVTSVAPAGATIAAAPAGETATSAESAGAAESTTSESDGPGGHADAAGTNVDHQFNGEE